MKKYELHLQGGVKLIITEAEKYAVEEALKNKDSMLEFDNNKFKSSMFKGIFEIREETRDNREEWIRSNQDWNDMCLMMSKRTPEDKTAIEIDNRILNLLNHDKESLPTEMEIAVVYANIKQFFLDNPKYPRCPREIWWPFVREKIKQSYKLGHKGSLFLYWWELVDRNDNAIAEWIKYQ